MRFELMFPFPMKSVLNHYTTTQTFIYLLPIFIILILILMRLGRLQPLSKMRYIFYKRYLLKLYILNRICTRSGNRTRTTIAGHKIFL